MKYGLIGEKLTHSFSKTIHNNIGNYSYELKEIPRIQLDSFLKEKDFLGINVTIPFKEKVIPYLDYVDENAMSIGAVNTVVNKDGKLYGYNKDFYGLKALLEFAQISVKNKKVLILGNGGTSKTAKAVVNSLCAKSVYIVSRTECNNTITYKEAEKLHFDADIIINATPCGMYPNTDDTPINLDCFKNLSGVVDVIYNPICSKLVLNAKKKKIKAIGGLYMLIAQAVYAAEKFFSKTIEKEVINNIYKKILFEKRNLVLIGMPSCGKSTVGKIIAAELQKEFIDTDVLIENKAHRKIPEIFKCDGEKLFREIESEVIKEISEKQTYVISTGGGAILNSQNIENLKKNGVICFLDRSLENLLATSDRPLSSNKDDLLRLYEARYELYKNCADFIVDANESFDNTIKAVKEGFINENIGY